MQISELKICDLQISVVAKFWAQAKAYQKYAGDNKYTLNYVFGQKVSEAVASELRDLGIKAWFIDDAGRMIEWLP